jgi:hypothetical protein
MKSKPEPRTGPFCLPFIRILYAGAEGRVVEMRILLILIVIIAVFVVVQAQRHGCKYDATLINCVLGKSGGEMPATEAPPAPETPAPAAPAAPETPAPAQPPAQ